MVTEEKAVAPLSIFSSLYLFIIQRLGIDSKEPLPYLKKRPSLKDKAAEY
ncbi:hypothetical protein VST7929_00271 [Vibrio stylophorae]|uniref:Uncharacterized protein n=1 Tax=Vibrio stylophorae TaxID=659351 RepID=A0ABN8DPF3_9VIBR|nr:hypothetical protein VST7929_00271 [Vibrio stylophorae]